MTSAKEIAFIANEHQERMRSGDKELGIKQLIQFGADVCSETLDGENVFSILEEG